MKKPTAADLAFTVFLAAATLLAAHALAFEPVENQNVQALIGTQGATGSPGTVTRTTFGATNSQCNTAATISQHFIYLGGESCTVGMTEELAHRDEFDHQEAADTAAAFDCRYSAVNTCTCRLPSLLTLPPTPPDYTTVTLTGGTLCTWTTTSGGTPSQEASGLYEIQDAGNLIFMVLFGMVLAAVAFYFVSGYVSKAAGQAGPQADDDLSSSLDDTPHHDPEDWDELDPDTPSHLRDRRIVTLTLPDETASADRAYDRHGSPEYTP